MSPLVPDTKLMWLISPVPLIFRTVLLKFSVHQIHQEALLKHRMPGFTPGFQLRKSGVGPEDVHFSHVSGDAAAVVVTAALGEPLPV